MSNKYDLGMKVKSFKSAPQYAEISKVVVIVSEDVEYSAGTDSGRTLTLNCPWGTQAVANNILKTVAGYRYQPFSVSGATLNPAAELADGVTVGNVYGGIYSMDIGFGPNPSSDISAPYEEEVDHEFPYTSKQERTTTRRLRQLTSELRVQAGIISAEVEERKSDVDSIKSTLAVQAGEISAKVEKQGGTGGGFSWTLVDDSWTVKSNGGDIFKVSKDGAEVTGKITATSGKIGGFDIERDYLSYNGQTWKGTNTIGAYMGMNGLQFGKNFRVDMSGKLYAASGEFAGSVRAGSIQYGGSNGYFNGGGIVRNSVSGGYGGAINLGTLSTVNFASAVNTSLGYANFAHDALSGVQECSYLRTAKLSIDKKIIFLKSGKFMMSDGTTKEILYLGW